MRSPAVVGLLLAGLLAMSGSAAATPATADVCGPVETVPDEGHHHLVEGNDPPVPYGSSPPTSGWHYRAQGEDQLGVHGAEEPLSEPQQVSVLAADGVVITYHDLAEADVEALAGYVDGEPRAVALTPYPRLEAGQMAMTAWNRKQVCDGLDLDAVATFVQAHAGEELDLTMSADDHSSHEHGEVVASTPAAAEGSGAALLLVAVIALAGLAVAGVTLALRGNREARSVD